MCAVQCAHALCAPYFSKILNENVNAIKIHACTPNYSSLALKTKKLGKQRTMCAVQCAHALCAPYFSKVLNENVYKILIHTCTPNYSSLSLKTKKLEKQRAMCAVRVYTVRTLFFKNFEWECLQNQNSRLHTKLQLSSFKNKKVGKTARNMRAICTLCSARVHCAHPIF